MNTASLRASSTAAGRFSRAALMFIVAMPQTVQVSAALVQMQVSLPSRSRTGVGAAGGRPRHPHLRGGGYGVGDRVEDAVATGPHQPQRGGVSGLMALARVTSSPPCKDGHSNYATRRQAC